MPFFTPHGLKIRLNPERVNQVIEPLLRRHDIEDILLDVELWENLPLGLAALASSTTALLSQSATLIISAGIGAYIVGSFIRGLIYSDLLRRLIPLFLGMPIFTAIQTLVITVYLIIHNQYFAAAALFMMNGFAYTGLLSLLDFPLTVIRVPLRKTLRLQPTHQESVFVAICDRRAKKYGIHLEWEKYNSEDYIGIETITKTD